MLLCDAEYEERKTYKKINLKKEKKEEEVVGLGFDTARQIACLACAGGGTKLLFFSRSGPNIKWLLTSANLKKWEINCLQHVLHFVYESNDIAPHSN